MKNLKMMAILAAVGLTLSVGNVAKAEVGYIDYARVLENYPAAQQAVKELDQKYYYYRDLRNIAHTAINSINGLDKLSTKYVNDLSNMFRGCLALTDIRFGRDFTVAEATKLSDMFSGCAQITNLDLTYFITRYVQYMDGMFEDCKKLTRIEFVKDKFKTNNVLSTARMFS